MRCFNRPNAKLVGTYSVILLEKCTRGCTITTHLAKKVTSLAHWLLVPWQLVPLSAPNKQGVRCILCRQRESQMSSPADFFLQQKDFFSKMVVDAVSMLDELLPLNMIGIKKVQGGSLEDSVLVICSPTNLRGLWRYFHLRPSAKGHGFTWVVVVLHLFFISSIKGCEEKKILPGRDPNWDPLTWKQSATTWAADT